MLAAKSGVWPTSGVNSITASVMNSMLKFDPFQFNLAWMKIYCAEYLDAADCSAKLSPPPILIFGSNWVAHYRARVHLDCLPYTCQYTG